MPAPDDTGRKQADTRFKPGQSGNPNGRPKGSRSKVAEAFLRDFYEVWEANGKVALEQTAKSDPATFVRVGASLLPKEIEATFRNIIAKELSDDELADIAVGSSEGASDTPVDPAQLN